MKLYVYCFVEDLDAFPESLTGIAGNQVRLLKVEDFSVLVSDFLDDTISINRHNVLAHAAVIQRVLARTTPLPFRFGTIVAEQELRNYVTAKRETLATKLQNIRGCIEMNAKVIWHGDGVVAERLPDLKDRPGTTFLAEKRRELLGGEARAAEAKKIVSWLEQHVGEIVREERIEDGRTDKLILAAAHLVERSAVEQYRARLKAAREQRPELHFLVSGPWAPYSFANIDLEFKSHFGVS
jgi:hypothetical protein